MLFLAYYSEAGTPATGLSVTVDLALASDGTSIVSGAAATEIDATNAAGWYRYENAALSDIIDYVGTFNGPATLSDSDRYKPVTNVEQTDLQSEFDAIPAAVDAELSLEHGEGLWTKFGIDVDSPTGDLSDIIAHIKNLTSELLTYYPAGGGSRQFRGLVERDPELPESKGMGATPRIVVLVANQATDDVDTGGVGGISSDEIELNGDEVLIQVRPGELAERRPIKNFVPNSNKSNDVEIR